MSGRRVGRVRNGRSGHQTGRQGLRAALGWAAFTTATLGLLIGGVLAAPFGAYIAKRVNADTLLTFVGAVLTATSVYALYRALA